MKTDLYGERYKRDGQMDLILDTVNSEYDKYIWWVAADKPAHSLYDITSNDNHTLVSAFL